MDSSFRSGRASLLALPQQLLQQWCGVKAGSERARSGESLPDRAELRRLPCELYRYQPESSDVIDGSVFAFVQGTDPEALLLIEAIQLKTESEWQFSFVRQTSGELEGRHNNRVVWTAEAHPARNDVAGSGLSLISPLDLKAELAK